MFFPQQSKHNEYSPALAVQDKRRANKRLILISQAGNRFIDSRLEGIISSSSFPTHLTCQTMLPFTVLPSVSFKRKKMMFS